MTRVIVDASGDVRCIHNDDVAEVLAGLGHAVVRRASHVEPDEEGRWWADMDPVSGPRLGPFLRRDVALAAEVRWILDHDVPVPR